MNRPLQRKNARRLQANGRRNGGAGGAVNRRALEMLELMQTLSYLTCLLSTAPRPGIEPDSRKS